MAVKTQEMAGRVLILCAAVALLAAFLALSAGVWEGGELETSSVTVGPAGISGSGAAVSTSDAWRPLREAGLERTEVGAARIGRSIFVVGGFVAPAQTTAAAERYDIGHDRWRRLPSMPQAVNHPAVASHRGFLYVYGGYTDSSFNPVTAALQRYDPRTGRWITLPSSPTPRAAAALVAVRGDLFAIGGVDGSGALGTLEVYDVETRRWHRATPMQTPREHIAAAPTAAGIYVFGGRSGGSNLDTVERLDPRRGSWSVLPHLLFERSGSAAAVVAGRPVVFGGEELTPGGRTIGPVELFDPVDRRWRRLPAMRTPRHGLGGVALGRRVYALQGGPAPGLAFSGAIEYFDVPRGMLR